MKILSFNWNNILTDIEEELKRRGHEILPHTGEDKVAKSADVIVVWNEVGLNGNREWVEQQVKRGKHVVLMQHGRRGTSRIYPPFNETLISDVVCVWGNYDKQRLISVGTPEDRIRVTGTTIFQHLKPRVKHKGYNVVFCPEHWNGEVEENLWVADELRKLKWCGFKKITVITKGLENEVLPEWYQNLIVSNRHKENHWQIVADVLSKADLVVGISESTFELLAQYLDIPVVIADCWIPKACDGDDRYKEYKREYSNACAKVPLNKLNETIKLHLKHPELLKKERAEVIIGDGGTNIANPLEEIIKVILDANDKRPRGKSNKRKSSKSKRPRGGHR